jgi:hypothetical protein
MPDNARIPVEGTVRLAAVSYAKKQEAYFAKLQIVIGQGQRTVEPPRVFVDVPIAKEVYDDYRARLNGSPADLSVIMVKGNLELSLEPVKIE